MKIQKNLGIWMDHSVAHFIDADKENKNGSVHSKFSSSAKDEALSKSEHSMHVKEQHLQEAFFKEIAYNISNYDHVLLFGPTNAKSELHNYLNKDLHFKDIQFDILAADNMTDKQQDAFVKSHFEN